MPGAAASALADLARALNRLGLRWYVFGAQAAIHYGSPRSTADVDVTVELAERAPSELLSALRAVGIEPRIELDEAFIAATRVLPMVHTPTRMDVDVVLAGPGPEETFLSRVRQSQFEGVSVPIASPTDLVVMKILAGRPKDLDDVVAVLRAAPQGLDTDDARRMLVEMEQLLGQSDLAPLLEQAIARARR